MNDKMTFDTHAQAEAEKKTMKGWQATVVMVNEYDGESDMPITRFAIRCKQGKSILWLRTDGYVR